MREAPCAPSSSLANGAAGETRVAHLAGEVVQAEQPKRCFVALRPPEVSVAKNKKLFSVRV